jgi:hypothetical protein
VPLHLSDPDSKEVKEVDERWLIPVRNPLEEEEFFHLRSCLVAQVTTPTKSYDNIEVAVLDQVGRIDRKAPLYNAEPDLTPRVLVHESGFSFSN